MAKKERTKQKKQTDLQPQLSLVGDEEEAPEEKKSAKQAKPKVKAAKGKKAAKEPPEQATLVAEPAEDEVDPKGDTTVDAETASEAALDATIQAEDGTDPSEVTPGNGVDHGDEASEGEGIATLGENGEAVAEEDVPEEVGPQLVRLVNSQDGCWMELDDGSKVDLNEDEWHQELARSFGRSGAD